TDRDGGRVDRTNFFYSYRGYVVCCAAVRKNSGAFRAITEIGRFHCDSPFIVEHSPYNVLFLESRQAIYYMLRWAEDLIDDVLENRHTAEKVAFSR
ncbi:hypothetical protein, partial [Paraburkholderia sp.]|uniref:hypothetical protein n=1 Tax=Paraburkholderia sp. TaxID=1926495 RepID=UPI0026140BFE